MNATEIGVMRLFFRLGDEPIGYPLVDLKRTLNESGFDASRVLTMGVGELIRVPGKGSQ